MENFNEKIIGIGIAALLVLCTGCATARGGAVSPDIVQGIVEYRTVASDIRTGETILATTSERIAGESQQIDRLLAGIELAIAGTERQEPGIGEIVRAVRNRGIPDYVLCCIREQYPEIFNGKTEEQN